MRNPDMITFSMYLAGGAISNTFPTFEAASDFCVQVHWMKYFYIDLIYFNKQTRTGYGIVVGIVLILIFILTLATSTDYTDIHGLNLFD